MKKKLAGAVMAATLAGTQPLMADDDNILIIEVAGEANGVIEIELLDEIAPAHVERIRNLARAGAYDNVVFHRVIEGFMAQSGDVRFGRRNGDLARAGMGGSDLPDLKAEFSDVPFTRGTVGMARSQHPDSANSQFFIMFADAPFLDGNYTVFGKVVAGQEVVDSIRKGSAQRNGAVTDPDYMVRARIKSDL